MTSLRNLLIAQMFDYGRLLSNDQGANDEPLKLSLKSMRWAPVAELMYVNFNSEIKKRGMLSEKNTLIMFKNVEELISLLEDAPDDFVLNLYTLVVTRFYRQM